MIRRTLAATQRATFSISLPNPRQQGMPWPSGTGFFISADGFFVTARHVITDESGAIRDDVLQAWLQKELGPDTWGLPVFRFSQLVHEDADTDLALLRVDPREEEFSHLRVSTRPLDEGEPVYAFGYPLPEAGIVSRDEVATLGVQVLRPRITSAIVSAKREESGPVVGREPINYVLDKALNYGNSGGPIVATETGHVHAVCTRFQPLYVPQHHLRNPDGEIIEIVVPSLYGIVSSLSNPTLVEVLEQHGLTLSDE